MTAAEPITILLPVYGRSTLLAAALESVLALDQPEWRLLIADDGSDATTSNCIQNWLNQHQDQAIEWKRRPHNLGLFANLNRAIGEAQTEWVLLLCSDDLLHPHAITRLKTLQQDWPAAELILSSFDSINADGTPRPADSARHHDQISLETTQVPCSTAIPALLKLGSINGNLTGMALKRSLWQRVGGFREDWRHAADWEWLVRAAGDSPLLLNRTPIAQVRTHAQQLSNSNRRSGHELQEVAEVVSTLVNHPLLLEEPQRRRWAAHVMQFQLWNVIKGSLRQPGSHPLSALQAIHRSAGLRQTALALVRWLPTRWRTQQRPSAR